MSFITFCAIAAVIFFLCILINENTDTIWQAWVVVAMTAFLTYAFFSADFKYLADQVSFGELAVRHFVIGFVFAIITLVWKSFILSRKFKRGFRDKKLADATAKDKRSFVDDFKKHHIYHNSGLFSITTVSKYGKEDVDDNTVEISITPNPTIIAEKLFHWTLFWPFFAIAFALRDGFTWLFEQFTAMIIRIYKALLNAMFSRTL